MKYYALDTETTLIKDRPCLLRDRGNFVAGSAMSRKGAIYTGPYEVPRLLFGSHWGPRGGSVYPAGSFIIFVRALLQRTPVHLIFHNAAFDIPVLCKAAPELTELFWAAMEAGRIHDTMALDVLYRLSTGLFDSFAAPQMRSRSLEEVAAEYCGLVLKKDPAIRLGFEQFENRVLPQAYYEYALQDAEATFKIWQNLLERCTDDKLLSEPLQTRAAVALSSLDQHGVHIDRAEATRLRRLFEQDIPPLEKTLVGAGLGHYTPKKETSRKWRVERSALPPDFCRDEGLRQRGVGNGPEQLPPRAMANSMWSAPSTMFTGLPLSSGKAKFLPVCSSVITAIIHAVSGQGISSLVPMPIICKTPLEKGGTPVLAMVPPTLAISTAGVIQASTRRNGAAWIGRVRSYRKHVVLEVAEPEFHLNTKALRNSLGALARDEGIEHDLTPTGLLGLDSEFWASFIPLEYLGLTAWVQYEKLSKIVGTYLKLYSSTDQVFPRWNIMGARSGRMSASSPNVQNIPKRKHGIRSLFTASPGMVFIRADYKCQELYCLAEAMLSLGISGPLFATLKAGVDIHTQTASLLTGKPIAEVTKADRQAGKACSFGVPGGLGPKKLADYAKKEYGVTWTLAESKEKRAAFLTGYPDIAEYLSKLNTDFNSNLMRASGRGISYWRETLNVTSPGVRALKKSMVAHTEEGVRRLVWTAERSLNVTLQSGRVRKGCLYTEAANTYFQGAAADVTKQAAFLLIRGGLKVVLVVHDEIVIEAPPEDCKVHAFWLEAGMLHAFKEICPNVGPYAQVEIEAPLTCWGAATDKEGKEI